MSWIGCLLLLSGWALVLSALLLLPALGPRLAFVLAGLSVELLGLALLAWSFTLRQRFHTGDRL